MNPNGIKKNDNIIVTRDDGKEYLGVATKVGPWAKNPKITVVNYHFKDGEAMYASKADARKCRMAPADMIPKPPEAAPIHPIMAKWSLGKTKRGPMMMEGYYFSIPVLLNGKRVGEIIDEGNGGSNDIRFKDHTVERAFAADCKAWALACGASGSYLEAETEFWTWWDDERVKGVTAEAYFKEKNEEMAKWLANVKPIHTGDLALVEGRA